MSLVEQRSHQPLVNIPRVKTPKKSIPKVTAKRAAENHIYSKLRKDYLEAHPYCMVWIMENRLNEDWVKWRNGRLCLDGKWVQAPDSTEVHHVKGRGKYLLDTNTWLAVSSTSHAWVHANPKISYEKGYMQPRR